MLTNINIIKSGAIKVIRKIDKFKIQGKEKLKEVYKNYFEHELGDEILLELFY